MKKPPAPKIPSLLAPTKDAPAYYVGGKLLPQQAQSIPENEEKNYERIVEIAKSSANGAPVRKSSSNVVVLGIIKEEEDKKALEKAQVELHFKAK